MALTENCCTPDCSEKKEYSKWAEIVMETVRDIFWKIRDVDGKEKQESLLLSLFQKLWAAKDIESLAATILEGQKNMKLKEIKKDNNESDEEEKEDSMEANMSIFDSLVELD